jgi:type VI secretion system secreted protein VgrG
MTAFGKPRKHYMAEEDRRDNGEDNAPADIAEDVAAGISSVAEVASETQHGSAAGRASAAGGALSSAAEAAGPALGEQQDDARGSVNSAGSVANTGSNLMDGGGPSDRATSGLGPATDASQYVVPDDQVDDVLGSGGQALQEGAGAFMGTMGQHVNVAYHLEVDGFDAQWGVQHVELVEQISSLYECVVRAICVNSMPEVTDLLGLDVHLQIERGEQMRSVHGIVRHAAVSSLRGDSSVLLHVVPAMWLLGQNLRSRVFTDKSVPEAVETIYQERCGNRQRTIRNDLTRSYPRHEVLIQFQESDLAFVQRRLEEEGIFTYFTHEGDFEELVLADVNSNLPRVRDGEDSQVQWCSHGHPGPDGEGIFLASHHEELGAQDVVVSEYNWTSPDAPISGEETGHSEFDPPLEVFDHIDAVLLHGYDGTKYAENDAATQARMRKEVLDLRRHRWEMSSLLVAARPGHVFELVGCPDGDLDGRYIIVSVDGDGSATEGESGGYENQLTVVPHEMPFRPARRTPVPVISGYQSATVVGPQDQEIHTDEHGRVRVRFPWDRDHQPSEHDLCSCWVRVMHSWAGPGFGTTFIPRIGMEVVVSFLNGSPDEPLVIGTLYHGTNRSPVDAPNKKTQSAIRTKSSLNSDGFNELRFEDEAGSEFIYTHAQKDYNEEVENNHSTHVKNNQTNTVDANQTETVGGEQKMTVKKDRTKTLEKNEKVEVHEDRTEDVGGDETVTIDGNRSVSVGGHETLTTTGNREMKVKKNLSEKVVQNREVAVAANDTLEVSGTRTVKIKGSYKNEVDGKYALEQGGSEKLIMDGQKTYLESGKEICLKTGNSELVMKNDGNIKLSAGTKVEIVCGSAKIEVSSSGQIKIAGGASTVEVAPSGVSSSGPKVSSSAQTINEITGLLVKIN